MFNRFTEIAKQTIVFAKNEAARLGSPEIGTEHIMLALLGDEDVTSRLMEGLPLSQIRQDILAHTSRRQELPPPVDLPLSTQSQELLTFAEQEAEELAHRQVSNSHLLLGVLRVRGSHVAQLLESRGLSAERVRARMEEMPVSEDVRGAVLNEAPGLSTATELPARAELSPFLRDTISQVKELLSRGEQRSVLRLLDSIMAESVPERSLRVRHLGPLATATARSLRDFNLVKHYCEMRLANDPADVTALYGMAECFVQQGTPDEAKPYIAKCYELSAARGDAVGQSLLEMLQDRFPERKPGF